MAKKKKHSGGRPAAYAQYQFHGPKLTKAQKAYNEEIRKAYNRIRSWEKRLSKEKGREVKLDLLPKTPPSRVTKRRIQEIREITWRNVQGRIVESVELDEFIHQFIIQLSDVDSHIDYPSWMSNWARWQKRERALRYRDKMVDLINQYKSGQGKEKLYARLKTGEIAQDLLRTARILYNVDSDNAEETACQGYFNEFKFILTGDAPSDMELRGVTEARGDAESYIGNENY